ncbi:class C sortase [Pseudoflavonifractor phocaeensis]|uniref:class C sortase n=1 Tax=Pseudoflavonifractor phocaeensis TaxID=1870988 RepID=UPI001F48ADAE|nr:class C sortase [Pseudoflavonifractor phocaeensis]MCF2662043.1 class C sortase [Pseudoflavonifractor phocaeensis]
MKKHFSTILLVSIFFIGLSVLLYPTLANYVNSKHQSRAIAEYVAALANTDPAQFDAELEEARAYNRAIRNDSARFAPDEAELEAFHHMLGANNTAIGYIEIPAIRVDLPLYLGTEESVLQAGAGVMPGSSLPIGGESTHTVLTGHRGLPSSRLFTDLDQLAPGDTFVLFVLNEVLTYEVDQIRIVLPEELDDLAIEEGKDYCTLVTCTPYGINTHRMLVRGHRIDNIEADTVSARVTADAIQVDTLLVTPVVAAPMLLVLLVLLMTRGGRKKPGKGKK